MTCGTRASVTFIHCCNGVYSVTALIETHKLQSFQKCMGHSMAALCHSRIGHGVSTLLEQIIFKHGHQHKVLLMNKVWAYTGHGGKVQASKTSEVAQPTMSNILETGSVTKAVWMGRPYIKMVRLSARNPATFLIKNPNSYLRVYNKKRRHILYCLYVNVCKLLSSKSPPECQTEMMRVCQTLNLATCKYLSTNILSFCVCYFSSHISTIINSTKPSISPLLHSVP
jgi:hypothetical protein